MFEDSLFTTAFLFKIKDLAHPDTMIRGAQRMVWDASSVTAPSQHHV
jgi:hypothetical protein